MTTVPSDRIDNEQEGPACIVVIGLDNCPCPRKDRRPRPSRQVRHFTTPSRELAPWPAHSRSQASTRVWNTRIQMSVLEMCYPVLPPSRTRLCESAVAALFPCHRGAWERSIERSRFVSRENPVVHQLGQFRSQSRFQHTSTSSSQQSSIPNNRQYPNDSSLTRRTRRRRVLPPSAQGRGKSRRWARAHL